MSDNSKIKAFQQIKYIFLKQNYNIENKVYLLHLPRALSYVGR